MHHFSSVMKQPQLVNQTQQTRQSKAMISMHVRNEDSTEAAVTLHQQTHLLFDGRWEDLRLHELHLRAFSHVKHHRLLWQSQ